RVNDPHLADRDLERLLLDLPEPERVGGRLLLALVPAPRRNHGPSRHHDDDGPPDPPLLASGHNPFPICSLPNLSLLRPSPRSPFPRRGLGRQHSIRLLEGECSNGAG